MWFRHVAAYSGLLLYPVAAAAISAVLTKCCIFLLPRIGLMDIPRGRHAHKAPTPRGGGLAIAAAFFITAALYCLGGHFRDTAAHAAVTQTLLCFAAPAAVILITGFFDDRYELSSYVKLGAQIIAAVMVFCCGKGFSVICGYQLPPLLGLVLTVFWVVAIINAFNLIDGLDGLAAGLACISSLTLAAWSIISSGDAAMAVVMLIFFASCLGFLRYNFYPAKIFMGDTGSMFIGLFFACVSTSAISKTVTFTSLLVPLLALGVPIFDVVLAIWRRLMRKMNDPENSGGIMEGDHDHLHHRLLKRNQGSSSKTACYLYIFAALLSVGALLVILADRKAPALVYFLLLGGIIMTIRLADIEILNSMTLMLKGINRPRRSTLLVSVHPLLDMLMLLISYTIVCLLIFDNPEGCFDPLSLTILLTPFVIVLFVSGVYRTFWLRAGINRFYLLIKMVTLAMVLEFIIVYIFYIQSCTYSPFLLLPEREFFLSFVLFYLLLIMMIAGERFFVRYIESFGLHNIYLQAADASGVKRIVILGGGLGCRLFATNLFCRRKNDVLTQVVGIIDDNRALRHKNVYGFNVLGDTAQLEEILEKTGFSHLVVTMQDLNSPALKRTLAFLNIHPEITVSYFFVGELSSQEIAAIRTLPEPEND